MPPSLFDRLPEELITKILDMIFEDSDDYPEGAHYFLEYQIFKRDPENYHGCFEIEFLVEFYCFRTRLCFISMKSACFRRLTPLLLLARGAMLRATHVASVSRQDCRALFAKLSDVEHQLEPYDDGRRAAVRLKRDSNTVPKCPAAAGRGEHQASRGLGWMGGW